MDTQCTIAVYKTLDAAEPAIGILLKAGFSPEQISLVTRPGDPQAQTAEQMNLNDDSLRDAAIGGAVGGITSALGMATVITVTGVGALLMVGPLVAMTGAVVGALVGAMRGWGVHDAHIQGYEELLREGKVLLIVNGLPRQVEDSLKLLRTSDALSVEMHAKASDESPEVDDRPPKKIKTS